MKKPLDIKKLLLLNMPYILMGLFATNFGEGWRMAVGCGRFGEKCSRSSPRCRWHWPAGGPACTLWTCWWVCAAVVACGLRSISRARTPRSTGTVWSTAPPARGTHEDIAPYIDPVFQNNVILTKTESLTMNSRPKDPKTARNEKMCW